MGRKASTNVEDPANGSSLARHRPALGYPARYAFQIHMCRRRPKYPEDYGFYFIAHRLKQKSQCTPSHVLSFASGRVAGQILPIPVEAVCARW
jgi:hypothetical protein